MKEYKGQDIEIELIAKWTCPHCGAKVIDTDAGISGVKESYRGKSEIYLNCDKCGTNYEVSLLYGNYHIIDVY